MTVFHGTDHITSKNIITYPNYIDRTKGGGELGMGFYTCDNPVLVSSWAKGRYGNNAKVIEFELDKSELLKLDNYVVKRRDKLILVWEKIKKLRQRLTYLFDKDVVMAPFATIDTCIQYKFESKKAEDFINKASKKEL